tara:strand:- start:867 stop:1166 length:300 start_codon:yes stop_codon:yes gene_type:complete
MLEKLCGPVIIYIGFCLVHILIDLIQKQSKQALIKFFVMFIFSFVLQILCKKGLGIISWIIVFIPFIFFTYLTAIIFFVFGVNPDNFDDNVAIEVIKKE